ncbi:MAG TPA: hypothetical protein VMV92_04580 [Streptosporangiaceae bacterium]|nr:hypothetical protein [Streptosporangiaceae bacterium]
MTRNGCCYDGLPYGTACPLHAGSSRPSRRALPLAIAYRKGRDSIEDIALIAAYREMHRH